MPNAIALVECSSIAMGYEVQDAMLKAASVELVIARTICSGKYLVVVRGDVAAAQASVQAGIETAREGLIDHVLLPNIDSSVFPAITGSVDLRPEDIASLGIIETFSASTAIEAADAAVKAGGVTLFRVHLAMAIGGKGFVLLTGAVGACEAAVAAGAEAAAQHGLLVNKTVIPGPRPELFREYI